MSIFPFLATLFTFLATLFLIYAAPLAIVCVPAVLWYRSIIWKWWEMVLLLVPFGLWLSLTFTGIKFKSLSNAVIELFLCGCVACMPIALRAIAARFKCRTNLAYFTGLLISSTVAAILYFTVPALPE